MGAAGFPAGQPCSSPLAPDDRGTGFGSRSDWEKWGKTFEDPDGYRVVLANKNWDR